MKKRTGALVLVLSMILGLRATAADNGGEESPPKPMNHIVVMYDVSDSVNKVDGEKRMLASLCGFLDEIQVTRAYKIAVIPFAKKCPENRSLMNGSADWWEVRNGNSESRNDLKKRVLALDYDGKYTNIQKALEKANQVLEEMRADSEPNKEIVLFITDGVVDVSETEDGTRLDNIIKSGGEIPNIANDFPVDSYFFGVVPNKETLQLKELITYTPDGKIEKYYGMPVSEEQQTGAAETLDCIKRFVARLNERAPNDRPERARVYEMDWSSSEKFQEMLETFFEDIWETSTTNVNDADLSSGYSFFIPEGVQEMDITIEPKADPVNEQRRRVASLLKSICLLKDGEVFPIEPNDSRNSLNLKLSDPSTGVYTLESAEAEYPVRLSFKTYGDIHAEIPSEMIRNVLGAQVSINGQIVYGQGMPLSEESLQYVTVALGEESGNISAGKPVGKKQFSLSGNSFQGNYELTCTGRYYVPLTLTYDDTGRTGNVAGVSRFSDTVYLQADVPKAAYEGRGRCLSGKNHLTEFRVYPYARLTSDRLEISARACEDFLGDLWVLRVPGEEDKPLALMEDGSCFQTEQAVEEAEREDVRLVNLTTGEECPWEMEQGACAVRGWDIKVYGGFALGAAALLAVLRIPLAISRRVRVVILRDGRPRASDYIKKKRGESKPMGFEGGTLILTYEGTTISARMADGSEEGRGEIENGNYCEIDLTKRDDIGW